MSSCTNEAYFTYFASAGDVLSEGPDDSLIHVEFELKTAVAIVNQLKGATHCTGDQHHAEVDVILLHLQAKALHLCNLTVHKLLIAALM